MTIDYDKYYTIPSVVGICCSIIKTKINIDYDNDLIIEPSVGNGAFINCIKSLCKNNVFVDIYPDISNNTKIHQEDYLLMDVLKYIKNRASIHIIGNPPFGFKASRAIKFIKKSASFCNTISFILPRSFEKNSMKNTIPLNFHLIHSHRLPKYSFANGNKIYDIPCVFQIWTKRSYNRYKAHKISPKYFRYVKNASDADIAIRRVGINAGKVFSSNLTSKNNNSHYFIKFDNKVDIHKISNIHSKYKTSVSGPLSISKYEITRELNKMVLA